LESGRQAEDERGQEAVGEEGREDAQHYFNLT
jgi:hypothetical protein